MRPQGKVSRIKRCKDKHNSIKGENIMMINDMKKNELNEQELNEVAGGGIIKDVKDLLEIGKTVGEMVSAFIDGSEDKNENRNSDIINHGSGAAGSW